MVKPWRPIRAMPSALSVLREFLFICLWEHCWRLIKCHQEGQVSLQSLCRMWPLATENCTAVLSQGSHPCTVGTVNPEDTTAIYKLSNTEKEIENWSGMFLHGSRSFKKGRWKPRSIVCWGCQEDPKHLVQNQWKDEHWLGQSLPKSHRKMATQCNTGRKGEQRV